MLSLILIFVGIAVAALGAKADGKAALVFILGGLGCAIYGLKSFFGF